MKKSLLWFIVIVVSLSMVSMLALSGCKEEAAEEPEEAAEEPAEEAEEPAEEEEASEEEAPGEPVTITVWADSYFTPEWQGSQGRILELIWNEFEEENNVTVNLELVPYGEFQNKLLQALKAGTAPDAVIADQYWLASMVEVGGVQPLNDLWSEEDRSDFLDWTVEGVTVDENIYGIWYTTDARVLFYRKDVLGDAGFSGPPENWDELYNIAEETTTEDMYGLGLIAGPGEGTTCNLLIDYWSQGGELVDSDNEPVFHEGENREALIEILDFYKKLFDEGIVPADSINYSSDNDMMSRIAANGYSMFFGGSFLVSFIQENCDPEVAEQWDIVVRPTPEGGSPTTLNGGFMLNVLSSDPVKKEAAWKFIWHLAQGENSSAFAEASSGLPVRKSSWETDKFYSEDYYMKKLAEILPYGKARDNSIIYPIISDKLSTAVGEVVSGQKTAEEAIDDAYEAVKDSM